MSHGVLHTIRRCADFLVFPDSNDPPSRRGKRIISITIPITIRRQLPRPPLPIRTRPRGVFGTRMPKAPVHEDRDAGGDEHDVNGSTRSSRHLTVQSEAKPTRMQFSAQPNFGVSVLTPLPLHSLRNAWRPTR